MELEVVIALLVGAVVLAAVLTVLGVLAVWIVQEVYYMLKKPEQVEPEPLSESVYTWPKAKFYDQYADKSFQ